MCVCVCAGEMSQRLKSSAEDTGLVLSTYTVTHNHPKLQVQGI